jgi:tetratricopeptide (TPR) repeat protein
VAHRSRGDWAEAASYYRVCLSLHQQDNDSRYGLGKALAAVGDRAGAIEALRRYMADERDPSKAEFVQRARGELAALEASAASAAAVPSAEAAALRAEAARLQSGGRLEAAVGAWRRYLELSPGDALAHNDLGNALFALHRYDEAVVALQGATALDRRYAVAWFNLTNALRKAGLVSDAVRAGERFVELEPSDPDGWYALAQAREAAGDSRGAVNAYRDFVALERRPERRKFVDKAERALAALGRSTAASDLDDAAVDRDDVLPMGSVPHLAELRDPFDADAGTGDDLLNPFAPRRVTEPEPPRRGASDGDGEAVARAREYAAALAAYRRALAAHAERVSVRWEKAVTLVIAGRMREASATFDSIGLDDEALVAARRSIERLRGRPR